MTFREFKGEDWVDRLVAALVALKAVQESYLEAQRLHSPRTRTFVDGTDVTPFPLEELRTVYEQARHSRKFGQEAKYAPLRGVLDPARHALLSHPTLERVAVTGRPIGDNDFWIEILNSGLSISAGQLIAGLTARAAELSSDGFRTAVRELNGFLSPVGDEEAAEALGSLDEGCDALLFYGLTVTERIDFREDMAILPYGDMLRFVDEKVMQDLAPDGAGYHEWRSVGAVVSPFRWRPAFRRRGDMDDSTPLPRPSFRNAAAFLDLLAVSHATAVVPLAALTDRIDHAAGRLLGIGNRNSGICRTSPSSGFDGFEECPTLSHEMLERARSAFENRESARYRSLAPVISRLAAALARSERFAIHNSVLDVAITLEGMYELPKRKKSETLQNRAAWFLGTDPESRERIGKSARAFYDARSAIVHGDTEGAEAYTYERAFAAGFDLARRTLFKTLDEGAPQNWNSLTVSSD